MKIIKYIPMILLGGMFFIIPFIHSHISDILGIKLPICVDGNYEFTKVMFFNILSGILIPVSLLVLGRKRKNIIIPKIIPLTILILIVSNYFSLAPFLSFFGNASKAHSTIVFLNIIGIFMVLINMKREFLNKLLYTVIAGSIIVALIGIKEYYFPTFDYGSLANRALSTFGHPNYLALYILLITPFIFSNKNLPLQEQSIRFKKKERKKIMQYIVGLLFIYTLILTKSLWGIIVFTIYILYKLTPSLPTRYKKILFGSILFIGFSGIGYLAYDFSYISKLHSFLSRFFIWDTTINIIFSDTKIFFVGGGLGTLEFIFDSFKSPYLYIFENFGFTADRPHNLFLNFFYHLGIFGLLAIVYIIIILIKKYSKSPHHESIVLFLVFTLFNFPGITHYLIMTLLGAIIYKQHYSSSGFIPVLKVISITIIILTSVFGMLFSIQYYTEENKLYKNKNYLTQNKIYKKIKDSDYEQKIFTKNNDNLTKKCEKLIEFSPSVENYFHCGNILWEDNKNAAKTYYKKGLGKIPHLWNKNSKYYKNPLVKYSIDGKRFFSEKYSNLKEILKRVGE